MKLFTSFEVLTWIMIAASAAGERPLLQVPGFGTLLGDSGNSFFANRTYYGFHSLYYAKQPTNESRFLPPIPADPMPEDEIYDAGRTNISCSQTAGGGEDCLFVNVFTPFLPRNFSDGETYDDLLPVMFWIHGGAFSFGGAAMYLPVKFMDWDVVFVEVQYRLGPLGFLCLDTDEVPGNAGLFDQLEALRWVQKYIKYFGGDPDLVTIFGESAGSVSVSHLMLTPLARGLFHRVIGQSGAALADWAIDRDARKHSLRVAELAGCPLEPYEALLHCLRNSAAEVLVDAYTAFQTEDRAGGGFGFGGSSPVIQKAGTLKFLEREPAELLESGDYAKDVPALFGANKHEGSMFLAFLYNDFLVPGNLLNDSRFLASDFVSTFLKGLGIRDDARAISDAVMDKYLEGAELGLFDSMMPGLMDALGVFFAKAPGYRQAQLHSRHNPGNTYWYSFDFVGRYSMFLYLFFGQWPPIPHGAAHGDEVIYMFSLPFPQPLNETENTISKRMLHLWTNFAKYGNPTPEGVELLEGVPVWPAYSDERCAFLVLEDNLFVNYNYTATFTISGDAAYDRPPNKRR